jgi:hypothetical protein
LKGIKKPLGNRFPDKGGNSKNQPNTRGSRLC